MVNGVFSIDTWTTCFWDALKQPRWAARNLLLSIFATVLTGLVCAAALSFYVTATKPEEPQLLPWPDGKFYQLTPREAGGYWLRLHYRVDRARNCIRSSTHQMFQIVNGQEDPVAFPLSGGINGRDMSVVADTFYLLYLLPIDFPSGDWLYAYRAIFDCGLFGLIRHEQKAPLVLISIP